MFSDPVSYRAAYDRWCRGGVETVKRWVSAPGCKTRHIVSLPDFGKRCHGEAQATGQQTSAIAPAVLLSGRGFKSESERGNSSGSNRQREQECAPGETLYPTSDSILLLLSSYLNPSYPTFWPFFQPALFVQLVSQG